MIYNNQLRTRLLQFCKQHPTSMAKLSVAIGISPITLRNFYDGKNVNFKSALLIEKFLRDTI